MMFGVLDYEKQKDQLRSYNSNHGVCYTSDGMKFPCKSREGKGFNEGDNVELRVDRKNKKIFWFVNDRL